MLICFDGFDAGMTHDETILAAVVRNRTTEVETSAEPKTTGVFYVLFLILVSSGHFMPLGHTNNPPSLGGVPSGVRCFH